MRSAILTSVFLGFLGFISTSHAQNGSDWRLYTPKDAGNHVSDEKNENRGFTNYGSHGEIDVIADGRINLLNQRKIDHPTKQDGYRVQIYFGNRNTARDRRADFVTRFPGHAAYISYLAPNFRLRVGDFRTRLESEKFKNEIARYYPGSYIVKDKIELPPLGGEEAFPNDDSDGLEED